MALLQFDYESVLSELTTRLQNKMGGVISKESSIHRILEIFAENISQLARYTEYLTRESKWSLAQNSSSILSQLELFGYSPYRKIGATGVLRISTDPSFNAMYPHKISIPKFSQFSSGGLTFCTSKDVELLSTERFVDVPVVQGVLATTTFYGRDINNYRYRIENDSIENSLYELRRTGGQLMEEVDSFGETQISVNGSESASQLGGQYEYKIRNIPGFTGVELQFSPGENIGDDIDFVFKYLITEGVAGNISSANIVTTPLTSFTDSRGVAVKLYCTNLDSIIGGTDYETIDEMRENAPASFNRINQLTTKKDYETAIRSLTGSSTFFLWTEQETNDQTPQFYDEYDFLNNCKIFLCGCSYDSATRTLKPWDGGIFTTINEKLQPIKGMTDYFISQDPSIIYFFFTGKVYYKRELIDQLGITQECEDNILANYSASSLEFFKNIYHSNYTSIFEQLPEVDHVDVRICMFCYLPKGEITGDSYSTRSLSSFGFTNTEGNKYIISSYEGAALVEDLGYTSFKDGKYKFYSMEGTELQPEDPDTIKWADGVGAENPSVGIFGAITLKGSYFEKMNEGKRGLVVRFYPYNDDAVLTTPNQILGLSNLQGISYVWSEETDEEIYRTEENSLTYIEV